MEKVKRTYNLSTETVRIVRELANDYRVARSQDAVVELAVEELRRRLTDADEVRRWADARTDRDFVTETDALAGVYRAADEETWPR